MARVLLLDTYFSGTSSWVDYAAGVVVLDAAVLALIELRQLLLPPSAAEVRFVDTLCRFVPYAEWIDRELADGDVPSMVLNDDGYLIVDWSPETSRDGDTAEQWMVIAADTVYWTGLVAGVEDVEGMVWVSTVPVAVADLAERKRADGAEGRGPGPVREVSPEPQPGPEDPGG